MKKVELLAPAGNIDSFKAACGAGADAIYMGLPKFNARTMAQNFDTASYADCINEAHKRGIKIFLTLNTLMYDNEMQEALELALTLYAKGLDAVIVQDIGLAMLLHQIEPNLPLHASTQMSVYSLEQVKYLQSLGFKRIVLARELTIDEIKYICDNTDVEIEVFVHGALCVCVSGQCLLSSTIGSRSANRGSCAQPCRMKYSLYMADGKTVKEQTYILSKKDIFGIGHINKLIEAGVTSLKIEGRNKVPEYTAGVVSMYRKYIEKYYKNEDITVQESDKLELMQLFNRNGISTGYLDKVGHKESITELSPKNTGLFLGQVIDKKDIYIKVLLMQDIDMHDGIEVYGKDIVSTIVTCIRDSKFSVVNKEMKKGNTVWLGDVKGAGAGDKIYKTSSSSLNEKYLNINLSDNRQVLEVELYIFKNQRIKANIPSKNIVAYSDDICSEAINKSIDINTLQNSFSKTLDTAYVLNVKAQIDDNVFVPVSVLNELRRKIVNMLDESYETHIDVKAKIDNLDTVLDAYVKDEKKANIEQYTSLYVYKYSDEHNYINIYLSKHNKKLDRLYINVYEYMKYENDIKSKYSKIDIYLYLPNVMFGQVNKYVAQNLENFLKDNIKGFVIASFEYLEILQDLKHKYQFEIVGDYTLNVTNKYSAIFLKRQNIDVLCISPELKEHESIDEVINTENVNDYLTVMTSRYCILGSFINKSEKCNMVCTKDNYYLKDTYGKKLNIVCDNTGCVMRLVANITNDSFGNTRNCVLN